MTYHINKLNNSQKKFIYNTNLANVNNVKTTKNEQTIKTTVSYDYLTILKTHTTATVISSEIKNYIKKETVKTAI